MSGSFNFSHITLISASFFICCGVPLASAVLLGEGGGFNMIWLDMSSLTLPAGV